MIHGHFYQPPREDPWLGEVETEPSAAPYHDWNERIDRECYRPVGAARIVAPDGRIARIVNTLASISFDFGPTLLEWMEHESPDSYAAVLEADRASSRTFGFGNAMAMPYHHAILPLCSRRDKVTEVRWGIADFRRRFRREPQGMWLPETAVDEETLDVLSAEKIGFTVLAPNQVESVPAKGEPLRFRTGGGRHIALLVYDGALSHDIAFGPLLHDAGLWKQGLLERVRGGKMLVSMATDGETYGHHHRFGEMALAALLEDLGRRSDVRVENFASFVARHPPRTDATLVSPSSWSCAHGVERWRADCGCRIDQATHQRWRAPLRAALDWLAGELHSQFDEEGRSLLADPWAARDSWGQAELEGISGRARELLEMERNALRMFTSCGWFFNDIGGIETIQVMRYAVRAIELAGDPDGRLINELARRLADAPSNDARLGDGRRILQERVLPAVAPPARVAAAAVAIRAVLPDRPVELPGYAASIDGDCVSVRDRRTGRERRYSVTAKRPRVAFLEVTAVDAAGGSRLHIALDQMPERYRDLLVAEMIRDVTRRHFTDDERDAVTGGSETVPSVARLAVVRAARALEHDQSAAATERLEDLLDLLALLGQPVPFDAQTAFYRLPSAGATRRLAARLGFVEGE